MLTQYIRSRACLLALFQGIDDYALVVDDYSDPPTAGVVDKRTRGISSPSDLLYVPVFFVHFSVPTTNTAPLRVDLQYLWSTPKIPN